MPKKKEKIKCRHCDKRKATYECDTCYGKFCGYCAKKYDYECPDCAMCPPELIKMQ